MGVSDLLERLDGKPSRAVLRGRRVSNGLLLPDPSGSRQILSIMEVTKLSISKYIYSAFIFDNAR